MRGTAPGGGLMVGVGTIGPIVNEPLENVAAPADRNMPDPARISPLLAANTR